jgi:hypothetical protein
MRDGHREIYILSNLPQAVAAVTLEAELYRDRWIIKTAFHELTERLNSEINTLGYPWAALFGFCIALVAYTILSAVKVAMRGVFGADTIEKTVSRYYLAGELSTTYSGMLVAIPDEELHNFRTLTHLEFVKLLRELAQKIDLRRFQTHPWGPKKPSPQRLSYSKQPHVSAARIIAVKEIGIRRLESAALNIYLHGPLHGMDLRIVKKRWERFGRFLTEDPDTANWQDLKRGAQGVVA